MKLKVILFCLQIFRMLQRVNSYSEDAEIITDYFCIFCPVLQLDEPNKKHFLPVLIILRVKSQESRVKIQDARVKSQVSRANKSRVKSKVLEGGLR